MAYESHSKNLKLYVTDFKFLFLFCLFYCSWTKRFLYSILLKMHRHASVATVQNRKNVTSKDTEKFC